jgi:glycosyltransferase involved in cell wall biosynthesis
VRLLVFEPRLGGHHSYYLRLLLPVLFELSPDVTLVTGRWETEAREFQVELEDVARRIRLECVVPPIEGSPSKMGRAKARSLAEAIERFRPEHIYVPAADHLTQMMRLQLPKRRVVADGVELEGLMMRGGFAYPFRGWRKWPQDRLSLLAIERAPWTILHFVDPLPYEHLRERRGPIARRVRLMPDPVEAPPATDRATARRQLGIPEDGRYIGSVGVVDERKGIDLLLGAFAAAAPRTDARLLLVGKQSPGIRHLLAGSLADLVRRERIVVIDRYVENEQLLAAVSALDVVCAPYPRHVGSASLVIRAAAAERPVLSSTFGWAGMVVPRLALGWSCDVSNHDVFAAAILAALERSSEFRPSEAARRFVDYHSVANFKAAWTVRLRDRLGLEPVALPQWDWVLEAPD